MRCLSRSGIAIFCLSAFFLPAAVLSSAVVGSDPGWTQAAGTAEADSLAAWNRIASVLRHARCLNCHQLNAPLQGDMRRVHIPPVVRGADDLGIGTMRCRNCHNEIGNNEM